MQEPVAFALAVDPGERGFAGARDEVVAQRLGPVPPAGLDALGPREQRELPFREQAWRVEQPQGPGEALIFILVFSRRGKFLFG
jgi:hypothetical protein